MPTSVEYEMYCIPAYFRLLAASNVSAQNATGFTVENADSNPSPRMELKAALYTAVRGELGRNGAESPLLTIRRTPLKHGT